MKFLYAALISFIVSMSLVSCSKSDTPNPGPGPVTSITLTASKTTIKNDGIDKTSFLVKDNNGNDVTATCSIYQDGNKISGSSFTSTVEGSFDFTASLNSLTSNSVTITVKASAISFTRKVYVEDFTGAWCGWCPLMAWNLDSMRAADPRVIFAAVHDDVGNAANDPFGTSYANDIENLVPNFQGFPTAFVNRKTVTDQFKVIQSVPNALSKSANAGLQIETTLSGNTLSAKVTTGFSSDYSGSTIKLAIMLVEDGLLSTQHNYYYHSQYVPPTSPLWQNSDLFSWRNDGVLRLYATDIKGDDVPSASTTINNVSYNKTVSFNLTGYNTANCRVIAMIISATGTTTEVLNVQDVKAGESQLFD
ncbi:MAG: Omp28-related outer membrane protein [Chitinophagaceae bacterium]